MPLASQGDLKVRSSLSVVDIRNVARDERAQSCPFSAILRGTRQNPDAKKCFSDNRHTDSKLVAVVQLEKYSFSERMTGSHKW